jgi:hypothetical protein
VPERCTCGAQLPPDARFCHKCGKPQSDTVLELEPEPEPEIAAPAPPATAAPPPLEIGFRNPTAVRIALVLALSTFGLSMLLGAFTLVWMLAVGGVAVWLYSRRTGELLTIIAGARLGWITGVFIFLISMVLISITALAVSDKAFVDVFISQMQQRGAEETAKQLVEMLRNPAKLIAVLAQMFVFCGALPSLGGILGAKLLGARAAH